MDKFNLRYLKTSAFIFICALLALALFTANNFIQQNWAISFSVFAAITAIFAFINNNLWHIAPFSWMYDVPNFSGRYEGSLQYEFRNETCEIMTDSLPHIKIIKQNGSDIIVRSWTRKKDGSLSSMSLSIDASIIKERDGNFKLLYNYINDGNSELGFAPHYGTEIIMMIKNGDGNHLSGKYYTERLPFQTKGKITLKFVSKNTDHDIN